MHSERVMVSGKDVNVTEIGSEIQMEHGSIWDS